MSARCNYAFLGPIVGPCRHTAQEHNMYTTWVRSSAALPYEGQPVEFILDDREIAIDGTYAGHTFCSRWTKYDLDRVGSWRVADANIAGHA